MRERDRPLHYTYVSRAPLVGRLLLPHYYLAAAGKLRRRHSRRTCETKKQNAIDLLIITRADGTSVINVTHRPRSSSSYRALIAIGKRPLTRRSTCVVVVVVTRNTTLALVRLIQIIIIAATTIGGICRQLCKHYGPRYAYSFLRLSRRRLVPVFHGLLRRHPLFVHIRVTTAPPRRPTNVRIVPFRFSFIRHNNITKYPPH